MKKNSVVLISAIVFFLIVSIMVIFNSSMDWGGKDSIEKKFLPSYKGPYGTGILSDYLKEKHKLNKNLSIGNFRISEMVDSMNIDNNGNFNDENLIDSSDSISSSLSLIDSFKNRKLPIVLFSISEYFNPTAQDLESLNAFFETGSTMVVASTQLNDSILSTFQLVSYDPKGGDFPVKMDDSMYYTLHNTNPVQLDTSSLDESKMFGKGKCFTTTHGFPCFAISNPDNLYPCYYLSKFRTGFYSSNSRGLRKIYNETGINALEVIVGKGRLIIITTPFVFSNYFMVERNNFLYSNYLLKYSGIIESESKVYYSTYYQNNPFPRGDSEDYPGQKSYFWQLIDAIFENKSLKAAFLIFVISFLIMLIFEGKRKQKLTPLYKPLKSASVEFAQTLGMLLRKNNFGKDLINIRVSYLMDFIKSNYSFELSERNLKSNKDIFIGRTGLEESDYEILKVILSKIKNPYYQTKMEDLKALEEILVKLNQKLYV